MPPPGAAILTLADVERFVQEQSGLSSQARTSMCSAISRFCEICGAHPTQVLADPAAIRALREKASWQLAGLKKQSWSNLISLLTRAMSLSGIGVHRRRRRMPLVPEWDALLKSMPERHWKPLRRFAGFCSARSILPSSVAAETFDAYHEFMQTQSVQRNPRERYLDAVRNWNKHVAGEVYPVIAGDAPRRWRSRPWSEFPESLLGEIDAWRTHVSSYDYDNERDALRPITIKNHIEAIRRYMSRLADDGVDPARFNSVEALLDPDMFKRGRALIQGNRTIEEAQASLHAMVQALLSLARHIEVGPEHPDFMAQQKRFSILRKSAAKVRQQPSGMTAKNRDRLASLQNPTAARLFRNLHLTIAARHAGKARLSVANAHEVQLAAVHALLLDLPLRISNVAALEFGVHITRPAGGQPGPWRIFIPASQAKGRKSLEFQLSPEASEFLSEYVRTFRPIISQNQSNALFVSKTGKAKRGSSLARQYAGFIRRELGLTVHADLLRHYAGMLWLDHMPGEYLPLSKMLGHASVTTTASSYTGAETTTALARYHKMLSELRAQDRVAIRFQTPEAQRDLRNARRPA